MNDSKPDGEAVKEADPIEAIKSAQNARVEKIGRRAVRAMQVAVLGMFILPWLGFIVNSPHRLIWKHFYDASFIQRVCFMWICLFYACMAIVLLAMFRGKYAGFFSAKPRTPSILIGLMGLSILVFAAGSFFSRPYTGVRLNWTPEAGCFLGGWFLIVWGFVFRK